MNLEMASQSSSDVFVLLPSTPKWGGKSGKKGNGKGKHMGTDMGKGKDMGKHMGTDMGKGKDMGKDIAWTWTDGKGMGKGSGKVDKGNARELRFDALGWGFLSPFSPRFRRLGLYDENGIQYMPPPATSPPPTSTSTGEGKGKGKDKGHQHEHEARVMVAGASHIDAMHALLRVHHGIAP